MLNIKKALKAVKTRHFIISGYKFGRDTWSTMPRTCVSRKKTKAGLGLSLAEAYLENGILQAVNE
jgi:hypothetical protein